MNSRITKRALILVAAAALAAAFVAGIIWGMKAGLDTLSGGVIALYVLGSNILIIKNMISGETPKRVFMTFLLMIKMAVAAGLAWIFIRILGINAHFLAMGFGSLPIGLTLVAFFEMLSPCMDTEKKQE